MPILRDLWHWREMDCSPEAAESVRLSFLALLSSNSREWNIPSVLGYSSPTLSHLEILKASLRTGFTERSESPTWVGQYPLRAFPQHDVWSQADQPLVVTSLAVPNKDTWEVRYGYHPHARFVSRQTGGVMPKAEHHLQTYGVLSSLADPARRSLLRFWLSPRPLNAEKLLSLLVPDEHQAQHIQPRKQGRLAGTQTFLYEVDTQRLAQSFMFYPGGPSSREEVRIATTLAPSLFALRELGKVRTNRESLWVYSGVQSLQLTQKGNRDARVSELFGEAVMVR